MIPFQNKILKFTTASPLMAAFYSVVGLILLFYPLGGLLADVYCGRYRCIAISLSMSCCTGYYVPADHSHCEHWPAGGSCCSAALYIYTSTGRGKSAPTATSRWRTTLSSAENTETLRARKKKSNICTTNIWEIHTTFSQIQTHKQTQHCTSQCFQKN